MTTHIPCCVRLLVFFFTSVIALGAVMLTYPLLEPCSLRISTLSTPDYSGLHCLETSLNFQFSLLELCFLAVPFGVLSCLISGVTLLCLNSALRKRIKAVMDVKKQ